MPTKGLDTVLGEGQLFIKQDGERIAVGGLVSFAELTPAELPDDYEKPVGRIHSKEMEFTIKSVKLIKAIRKMLRRMNPDKMTRKRFIKLLMGMGVPRDSAVVVTRLVPIYGSYAKMWRMMGFKF